MSQEPTTAERRSSTERLTPPAPLAPRAPRRRPGPLRWAIMAGVVLLALVAVFILTRPGDPMADTRPTDVVRGFAAAIEARDATKMLSYVEPTIYRREISPEIRAYVEYLQAVRFDNPRYQLLDNDGEIAHVRWTATMNYTIGQSDEARSGSRPIDTTFELRTVEGTWYLHGANLPK
jgi:hypothetical protein